MAAQTSRQQADIHKKTTADTRIHRDNNRSIAIRLQQTQQTQEGNSRHKNTTGTTQEYIGTA